MTGLVNLTTMRFFERGIALKSLANSVREIMALRSSYYGKALKSLWHCAQVIMVKRSNLYGIALKFTRRKISSLDLNIDLMLEVKSHWKPETMTFQKSPQP